MKIIDAHSHIDYITHHFQNSVVGTIICTTKESEWDILKKLMCSDNAIYGAWGIHPWFVDSVESGFDVRLEQLLKTDSRYMVGEIGLDKNHPNMTKQFDVFQKQFDIAVKLKRTIFIHCVGAWDKVLHLLKQYKKQSLPTIVFHAFNANDTILKDLLKSYSKNVIFSFGKNALCDRISRIKEIDCDRILIESDGKSDLVLTDVVNELSKIKDNKNVADVIYNNTQRILKK